MTAHFPSSFFKDQPNRKANQDMLLETRLKAIAQSGRPISFVSSFSLADQILTYALISSGLRDVTQFRTDMALTSAKGSLRSITEERYAVTFETRGDTDGKTKSGSPKPVRLTSSDILGDWSQSSLVAYVLDHEIPVDPFDMPGFTAKAA